MAEVWAVPEFVSAKVGDKRRRAVLSETARRLVDGCGLSYSVAVGHGGRQAARRVFRHPGTTVEGLLSGHFAQTVGRCAEHEWVYLIQDTTRLDFSSHKATHGLGPLAEVDYARGLLSHGVYAVTPEGLPLGLLDLWIWARPSHKQSAEKQPGERALTEKESFKWIRGLRAARTLVPARQKALVIQDREADVFELFAEPRRANLHLLVRACQPRRCEIQTQEGAGGVRQANLLQAAAAAPILARITVRIPRKPGQAERETTLCVRARRVRVLPPRGLDREPQTLFVVCAHEETPSDQEEPLEWVLITTLPIETPEQACWIVNAYTVRWSIELLHRTLKSGCRVERLQIDDATALINAIALHYVVAWRIHWLTHLARTEPDRPAVTLLAPDELAVLEATSRSPIHTAAQAVLAIAKLGGYVAYKSAKPPGTHSIWLGLRKLNNLVVGWNLALSHARM